LAARLNRFQLLDTNDRGSIHLVKVYGEAFEKISSAPPKVASRSTVFSIRVELHWYATAMLGLSSLGPASGVIKVGEIDFENLQDSMLWNTEVKLESEVLAGVVPSKEEQISEIEKRLKNQIHEDGVPKVLSILQSSLLSCFIGKEEDNEEAQMDPKEESKGFKASCSPDLRRQLLGKKFLQIWDTDSCNEEETWDLRINSLDDRDMKILGEKASKNHCLKTLDLYFNSIGDEGIAELANHLKDHPTINTLDLRENQIGDAGTQALCAVIASGGLPNVRELRLEGNKKMSDTGKLISEGLKLIRRSVQVKF